MTTRSSFTAGKMREDVAALGTLPFDAEFISSCDISDFQRDIADGLLTIVEALPRDAATSRAVLGREAWPGGVPLIVNIAPRDTACAEMTIYVDRDACVHIGAGHVTTFGLPNDVWDPRSENVSSFTMRIVASVAAGGLRETIHYRGDSVVKSESVLDIDGIALSVERIEMGVMLLAVFRARKKREVVYPAYS